MRYWHLTELFDRKAEYTVVDSTDTEFIAEFVSGGRTIRWSATYLEQYDDDFNSKGYSWGIEFSQLNSHGHGNFNLTKGGNEFEVMSTVKAIMKEFFHKCKPESVNFSASNREESRVSLYTKMAMKFVPSTYELNISDTNHIKYFEFTKK